MKRIRNYNPDISMELNADMHISVKRRFVSGFFSCVEKCAEWRLEQCDEVYQ